MYNVDVTLKKRSGGLIFEGIPNKTFRVKLDNREDISNVIKGLFEEFSTLVLKIDIEEV